MVQAVEGGVQVLAGRTERKGEPASGVGRSGDPVPSSCAAREPGIRHKRQGPTKASRSSPERDPRPDPERLPVSGPPEPGREFQPERRDRGGKVQGPAEDIARLATPDHLDDLCDGS